MLGALAFIRDVPTLGDVLTQLAILALLVLVSAFASGSEVALIGLSRIRRRQLVEEGHPRIGAVEALMARPERLLITILLVNALANTMAAVAVTLFVFGVFDSFVFALATGIVTFALLTFGEIAPKALAASSPERFALAVAPILLGVQRVLWPLIRALEGMMSVSVRSLGKRGADAETLLRSEEELKTLITAGMEEGVLEAKEEDMLHSVIEFGETTAKEIMVPRIDMTAVPADATLDHIRAFVVDSGFSRIPVYQGTVDNVVGVLHTKDVLLALLDKKGSLHVRDLMREAFVVPESKKLDDLLTDMREKRVHMAIVIDEFGGTAGIVTLEDVLEEVVGDIFDEYDLRSDPVRHLDETTAVVDARTHVADVNDALDIEIPEEEGYDTVAGYVYDKLGRLGKEGEVVHGPGFDMVVEKVSNRRILRVRVVKHSAAAEGAPEEASVG